jgi:multidrug efflux pump subunit AcrB
MYSQFALVIAATALLSAINAATLKPTQCALWLRRPRRRNSATSSTAASTPSITALSAGMPV